MGVIYESVARSQALGVWLGIAAKAAALLLAAVVVSLALRRASSATRHFVWTSALLGCLVLPMTARLLPATLLVPMLPPRAEASRAIAVESDPSNADQRVVSTPSLDSQTERPVSVPSRDPAPTSEVSRTTINWAASLAIVWLAGSALALVPVLAGMAGIVSIARRATVVADPALTLLGRELSAQLGLRRRVRIVRAVYASIPMTWGSIRPTILLPAVAEEWTEGRRRLVLLHELAHIKRLDCLTQQLAQLACALYWFNPLTWLAAHRMRVERERACDDIVLRLGSRPSDYASHLVALASTLRPAGLSASVAVSMVQRSQLERRIRAILESRSRPELGRRAAFAFVIAGAMILMALSAIQFDVRADQTPDVAHGPDAFGRSATMIVRGRVRDAEGRPVMGATVVVVDQNFQDGDELAGEEAWRLTSAGLGRSGKDGEFQAQARRNREARSPVWMAFAMRAGHGFGIKRLSGDDDRQEVTITLTRERVVHGRLVDLQGQPAARVKAEIVAFGTADDREAPTLYSEAPPADVPIWPGPVETDDQGRFQLHGFGLAGTIVFKVRDEPFALQTLVIPAGQGNAGNEFTGALAPARILVGRVTAEATGKPLARASLKILKGNQNSGWIPPGLRLRTDDDGRYRVNLPAYAGEGEEWHDVYTVRAYPPDGAPACGLTREFTWTDSAARTKTLDITMPRGVVVRGRVTERSTGRPVAGARVGFAPRKYNNLHYREDFLNSQGGKAVTDLDGSYEITAPPGPGYLRVDCGSPDFIREEIGSRAWTGSGSGGSRMYAHAWFPTELKADASVEVNLAVRRGTTVKARIVGPDGLPNRQADVFCVVNAQDRVNRSNGYGLSSRDARFEFRGCDPERSYDALVLDRKNRLGALVNFSGKPSGDELVIRLVPCGSATARFVNGAGNPVGNYSPPVRAVLVPGPHSAGSGNSTALLAEEGPIRYSDRMNPAHQDHEKTDADGRVTLPALVPGATYRVGEEFGRLWKQFTAGSGQTVDLGTITVTEPQ